MTDEILLTISIPTFNSSAHIKETLESLSNQTYKNFYLRVVDNCSTDNTVEIIEEFRDKFKFFELIVNDENLGWAGNCNKCVLLTKTKYLAIYHSDDVYEEDIVDESIRFMRENPQVGGLSTLGVQFDGQKILTDFVYPESFRKKKLNILSFDDIYTQLLVDGCNFLICPSFMFKTKVLAETGVFEPQTFGAASDVALCLKVATHSGFGLISKKLIKYRVHVGQTSETQHRKSPQIHTLVKVLKFYKKYRSQASETDYYRYLAFRLFVSLVKRLNLNKYTQTVLLRRVILSYCLKVPLTEWKKRTVGVFLLTFVIGFDIFLKKSLISNFVYRLYKKIK